MRLNALALTCRQARIFNPSLAPLFEARYNKLLGDPDMAEHALHLYRERLLERGLYQGRIYEGIPEVLACLTREGHRLYCATSKLQSFAIQTLRHFKLAAYFSCVYGSDLDGALDDKRTLLASALELAGEEPTQSAMIGDRYYDIEAARHNKMWAIGVAYGYGNLAELLNAGAETIIYTPQQLKERIEIRLRSREIDR